MTSIQIINQSTVVSDVEGSAIVSALNLSLPAFCKVWSLSPYTTVYVPKGKSSVPGIKIFIKDIYATGGGIMGYHDLVNEKIVGYVFAKSVLQYGGVVLYSTNSVPTVSQTVSHELYEMLIDPYANCWVDNGTGKVLYAREVCDPVQTDITVKTVQTPGNLLFKKGKFTLSVSTKVALSSWVYPEWFDPQSKTGPYDLLGKLKAPLTIASGGYAIQLTDGTIDNVFGSNITNEQKVRILSKRHILKRKI
jgi:hypothetical protein